MLSNQIIQECIDDISQIMHAQMCVFDTDGVLAADNLNAKDEMKELAEYFVDSPADSQQVKGYYFFKIYDGDEVAYVVVAGPDNSDGYSAGKLAVCQIGRLMEAYQEQFSEAQFVQNLYMDNLLEIDIYNQSKQLGIDSVAARGVFLIETEHEQDEAVLEMIRQLYGKGSRDFVAAVDEKKIVLLRELRENNYDEEMMKTANMLMDMINVEAMSRVRLSYGNQIEDIKEVPRACREAKMALEVGRIFYSDKSIVAYNMLGIGRLIYKLSPELCDMFLEEVFTGGMPEKFDEETLATINKFFELNLNLSETARQMYVHRNTLAYRLERIEKMTGLDIRSFEDAMTFKLALMVADYRRMTKVPMKHVEKS